MARRKAGNIDVDMSMNLTIPRARGRPVMVSVDVDQATALRDALEQFIKAAGGE